MACFHMTNLNLSPVVWYRTIKVQNNNSLLLGLPSMVCRTSHHLEKQQMIHRMHHCHAVWSSHLTTEGTQACQPGMEQNSCAAPSPSHPGTACCTHAFPPLLPTTPTASQHFSTRMKKAAIPYVLSQPSMEHQPVQVPGKHLRR